MKGCFAAFSLSLANDSLLKLGGGFGLGGADEQSGLSWRSEIQTRKCLSFWGDLIG